jgi:hypothetical protein
VAVVLSVISAASANGGTGGMDPFSFLYLSQIGLPRANFQGAWPRKRKSPVGNARTPYR